MRNIIISLILLLLTFSITFAADKTKMNTKPEVGKTEIANTTEIIWHRYDEGLKLATEKNKHIMIDFSTKWCGYCKKMNKTTFKDPDIIKILNENFISIKVDGDSKEELNINGYKITERDLTRSEYRVKGFPAFWFLKSNTEKIGPVPGYKPADQFMGILCFIKDKAYDKMTYSEYIKSGGCNRN